MYCRIIKNTRKVILKVLFRKVVIRMIKYKSLNLSQAFSWKAAIITNNKFKNKTLSISYKQMKIYKYQVFHH